MRIPPDMQGVANDLRLRELVKSRKFPRDRYYESIELYRDRLTEKHPNPEDENLAPPLSAVAPLIAGTIASEGLLLAHCLENGIEVGDEAEFWNKCMAMAWATLQAHERDVNNGRWPK